MKLSRIALAASCALLGAQASMAESKASDAAVYADFPVTLKNYDGDATNSVAYPGQIARYVLHDSIKKLASSSDLSGDELRDKMLDYFSNQTEGREIIAPAGSDEFPIKQTSVDDISADRDLVGKNYDGVVTGWPGNMTGDEFITFLIEKAAESESGYDPVNGYDYAQLISKTLIGSVFYNQAVDNYLDEKLTADVKPNDQPYGEGSPYTGKEHSWDEAFGYFGAPAHVMSLDPETTYQIAKTNPDVFEKADANGDGEIDLMTEMTFANAYYAANADKSGKSTYLHDISQAFIDGRQLISDANGERLSDEQLAKLNEYADTIKTQWEQVLAEAAFKYAGSVYMDLQAIEKAVQEDGDIQSIYRDYAKHWGELKGFSLALQMGGKDMAGKAVEINELIGYSPLGVSGEQVTGIEDGEYVREKTVDRSEYMANMVKLQSLLKDTFDLSAQQNAIDSELQALSDKLGEQRSAEND